MAKIENGNDADEWVILFLAISSSDNLQLGIGLGLGSVLNLTYTFQTPTKFISPWLNNITRSSATLTSKTR